jgi:hypothetical protein
MGDDFVEQKLIENRPQGIIAPRYFGEPIALHAGRKVDEDALWTIVSERGLKPTRLWRATSAVIGVATVVGAVHTEDELRDFVFAHWGTVLRDPVGPTRWFEQQRHWFTDQGIAYILRDPIALKEPVPCKGWQGCRPLPTDVAALVRWRLETQGTTT